MDLGHLIGILLDDHRPRIGAYIVAWTNTVGGTTQHSSCAFFKPHLWRCTSDGRTELADEDTVRTLDADGTVVSRRPRKGTNGPFPIRIASPLALSIWGRSTDDYRIGQLLDDEDGLLTAELVPQSGHNGRGRLSVDVATGMITEMVTAVNHVRVSGFTDRGVDFDGPLGT